MKMINLLLWGCLMAFSFFNGNVPEELSSLSSAEVRGNFNALFQGDSKALRVEAENTPGMTLKINASCSEDYYAGVWFNGGLLELTETSSPPFSAPSTYPRIDVLYLSAAGQPAIAEGTESATPVAPALPPGAFPLAQVYLKPGMTKIVNFNEKDSYPTEGYILKDIRPRYRSIAGPTIFIAASNASNFSKQKADIVCGGTNDQVKINDAISRLSNTGGRIVLSEGTFNLSNYITISGYNNLSICGMGPGSTTITGSIYGLSAKTDYLLLRDFSSTGNIHLYGDHIRITNVNALQISFSSANYLVMRGCKMGILKVTGSGTKNVFIGNILSHLPYSGYAIFYDLTDSLISNNVFESSYLRICRASYRNIISDNLFYQPPDYGIHLYPYGGSSPSKNSILGNQFYDTEYGIQIDSGCADNLVRHNFALGCTSVLLDNGTNTLKAASTSNDNSEAGK